ncbi:hypothetical protein WJX72_006536 [[Myrmecia] bisecta]|uniref:UV-endonuclease UvdE n=1 Tax=[Myrmecia] bisecta TaxID=41462 RepID=A0AAW1PPM8_9CHLO
MQQLQQLALPPLPVPNLGYACLNQTLRLRKPTIFSGRECRKRTFERRGLVHVSQLALANCIDLLKIVQWNHEHGIRLFRVSSNMFPWASAYHLDDLPDFAAACDALAAVGQLARSYGQRLTSHPSHFVQLAAQDESLVQSSLRDLEVQSQIFDLMGFAPSHWNKINIHVGGAYGDKPGTLLRFARSVDRLSADCRARLTVENDDRDTMFSTSDLLPLHDWTGVPLVFDFHHHKFCAGLLSEAEALEASLATWPQGIRPIVHWSESQEGRKPHAHSDLIMGPMCLHGREAEVDVMVEAKHKELAVIEFQRIMAL